MAQQRRITINLTQHSLQTGLLHIAGDCLDMMPQLVLLQEFLSSRAKIKWLPALPRKKKMMADLQRDWKRMYVISMRFSVCSGSLCVTKKLPLMCRPHPNDVYLPADTKPLTAEEISWAFNKHRQMLLETI